MAPLVASPRLPWQARVAALYAQLKAARDADNVFATSLLERQLNAELDQHIGDTGEGGGDGGA